VSALLEVRGLVKRFPGVLALDGVSLSLQHGEVHALMGENGAGKSTLVKVLTGVYVPDAGEILWLDSTFRSLSPAQVGKLGISVIYQESSLIPRLSIAENVYLGRLPTRSRTLVDWRQLEDSCRQLLEQVDLDVAPMTPVHRLSSVDQRMVEVARSLSIHADLIIMDEPTAALSAHEIDVLFGRIRRLRERGVAVLYISHFLEEVFEISDRITVLRDGHLVATVQTAETTPAEVVFMMAGRRLSTEALPKAPPKPEILLRVDALTREGAFQDVSFELHAGEILGLAGPVGSGRTTLVRALFGIERPDAGRIWLGDRGVTRMRPADALQNGVGFVPEDRRGEGVLLDASVARNISLPSLNRLSHLGLVSWRDEVQLAQRYAAQLDIKTTSLSQRTRYLSGGNQQKVVISKWLALNPRVLILDEPTQGIDVATKEDIYQLISELSHNGVAILYASSEPTELARLCHRVLTMRRGCIVSTLAGDEIQRERIIEEVTGAAKA
jgi:ABC-type sugar transport system ATPase subunit